MEKCTLWYISHVQEVWTGHHYFDRECEKKAKTNQKEANWGDCRQSEEGHYVLEGACNSVGTYIYCYYYFVVICCCYDGFNYI